MQSNVFTGQLVENVKMVQLFSLLLTFLPYFSSSTLMLVVFLFLSLSLFLSHSFFLYLSNLSYFFFHSLTGCSFRLFLSSYLHSSLSLSSQHLTLLLHFIFVLLSIFFLSHTYFQALCLSSTLLSHKSIIYRFPSHILSHTFSVRFTLSLSRQFSKAVSSPFSLPLNCIRKWIPKTWFVTEGGIFKSRSLWVRSHFFLEFEFLGRQYNRLICSCLGPKA